ncbi:MAG: TIM barrel protein [Actinobacteria bacterium]|nr:TIM barrel protein [Actinomycetota bacterium]
MRIASAPLSYGAFEVTVGIYPNVPGPDELLAEIAAAGYEGTELGPPGYLGDVGVLRTRLERHGLALTGGWCPIRFSEPERLEEDLRGLERTLDLFDAAGAHEARPVFGDGGSDERRANPGRGAPSLDDAGWRRWADGVKRAQEVARGRGYEPTLHPHTSTFVESPQEIECALELTDIGVLVDTGHLLLGSNDPIESIRSWGARVNYVHVKDVRLGVVHQVVAERADVLEGWRRGMFCELGQGDVDLPAFFDALRDVGYDGWIVVEQDRIPRPDEQLGEAAEAQVRNRAWLQEHAGV